MQLRYVRFAIYLLNTLHWLISICRFNFRIVFFVIRMSMGCYCALGNLVTIIAPIVIIFHMFFVPIAVSQPDIDRLRFVAIVSYFSSQRRIQSTRMVFAGPSARRSFSGSILSQRSIYHIFMARWERCIDTERITSIVQHGNAFENEIQKIVAARRPLLSTKHASLKQSCWALCHECPEFVGRTITTDSVWKPIANSMATSRCLSPASGRRLCKKFHSESHALSIKMNCAPCRSSIKGKHLVQNTMLCITNC